MRRIGLVLALACSASVSGTTDFARPVADAAARGDVEKVRELLRIGADVNTAQGDGMAALHWAASRGDFELTQVLLYSGANVGAGTRIGHYTPLHLASRLGHEDVVQALLRAKADPNAKTTNSGVTPLHLAAAAGKAEVLEALLASGADVNAAEASWGQTPLIFAASQGRVEAIRTLLAAGADANFASRAVNVVEMEKADEAANKKIAEILEGFKKQEKGGGDWKPSPSQVQVAIEASRHLQRSWPEKEAAEKTPAKGAAKADASTPSGSEPGENADKIRKPKDGKNRDENPPSYGELVESWGGLTPLLHAARQGHTEASLALLDGGAEIDRPSTGDRTTPLLMAAVNGQFDLAMKLLDRGANPNLASAAGTTPLFATLERTWAPRASYAHPIEHQQQKTTYLELLEALLEADADPNVRLAKHLWYMEYTFGVLRAAGID
jgi:uncharacterized protein